VSGGSGSSSERLKRAKRALRRDVIARRDALPERDRAAASLAIADRVAAMPEAREAGSAMAFWSFGSEVDTAPLIERWVAEGKVVALPRIGRLLDPSELDLVIVPGVAFDRPGNRVGYGAGYYDRLLGRTRPGVAAVAIAFALQIVSEVPTGRTDRRVDAIVTETEVIRCRP
jgi:5-formyltetrahydrofolate cyclo-ligase